MAFAYLYKGKQNKFQIYDRANGLPDRYTNVDTRVNIQKTIVNKCNFITL